MLALVNGYYVYTYCSYLLSPYVFLKFYNQDSNYITSLFMMSIFKDILVKVCDHGNQHAAVLMSCKNTDETVLAYDPIHLDYIVALTK